MSATASSLGKFYASTDGSTWTEFSLASDANAQLMRDLIEITNYKNARTTPEKERMYGLGDKSFDFDFFFDDSDTDGQKAIRTALINRSALYIKALFDGTHGFSSQVLVENINFSSPMAGAAGMKASLKGSGALTTY